jgi:hypothetical protein
MLWRLDVSGQMLYFLPDRLLIYQGGSVGALAYNSVDCSVMPTRFIESEGVPSDSQVVGQTWRYVNKGGGPDRRFGTNPQIPIALYGQVNLHSQSGMNIVLHASSVDNSQVFASGLKTYAQHCSGVQEQVKGQPEGEALSTPEFAPSPYSPILARWGWAPAPLLLIALLVATVVLAAQRPAAPATTVPPAVVQVPAPTGPPPKFQVFRNQRGQPVVVVVSGKTTDQELKNLLFLFRDKTKAGRLPDVGIRKPTHKGDSASAADFSTGSILVYRGKKYANETAGQPGNKFHADATYSWAPNGESALVRSRSGMLEHAF